MINNLMTQALTWLANVADSIPDAFVPSEDLENDITALSLRAVLIGSIILVVFSLIAWQTKDRWPKLKAPLFIVIAGTMVISTITLIGSTVYLNIKADSGGPVHWHADIEFWACGNELELRDPTGFSNKIGTWTLHEHDDHRIHLEGVVVDETQDASLGKFMHVIDGVITDNDLIVPLNPDSATYFEDEVDGDGASNSYATLVEPYILSTTVDGTYAKFSSGQDCGGQTAEVQVFVYQYDEASDTYSQTKLQRPQDYSISRNPNVPPGDCVIFEFDVPKTKTDKLCAQYGIRDVNLCEAFGVEPNKRGICTMEQTDYDPNQDYRIIPDVDLAVSVDACGYDAASDNFRLSGVDCGEVTKDNALADRVASYCGPFYDEFGQPTGVEIATYMPDGTFVVPDRDCLEYRCDLQAGVANSTPSQECLNQETEEESDA